MHSVLRDENYRNAAEALRDSFRHAQATRVEFEICYDNERESGGEGGQAAARRGLRGTHTDGHDHARLRQFALARRKSAWTVRRRGESNPRGAAAVAP
jgi:hypothetical protein